MRPSRSKVIASPALPETPAATVTPIERAEAFVAATGAIIHHGGTRAFYRPSTDAIHLPPREAFVGTATSSPAEGYYSTLCHELIHFTSAEHRCNRQLGKRFGDQAYAMEELIAELGAAFLCADLGISDAPRADHAQYLTTWLCRAQGRQEGDLYRRLESVRGRRVSRFTSGRDAPSLHTNGLPRGYPDLTAAR